MDQLIKAGIFTTSRKRAYNRLLVLRRANLIKACRLNCGQMYYYLSPRGGETLGLPDLWYSKLYRNAGADTVLRSLIACDFALAADISYLPRQEVLSQLMTASYDVLAKCLRSNDLLYKKGDLLHVLIIDYQYSLKYLAERIRLYSRLPVEIQGRLMINILVFSKTRQEQVLRITRESGVRVRVLRANWKY